MRATEIIRNVLDLIDQVENCNTAEEPALIIQTDVIDNGFDQIMDLLSNEYKQMYDNSPSELVSGIDSVTTNAGGGWNGPKNPADLRADSVSMYPNHQHKPE